MLSNLRFFFPIWMRGELIFTSMLNVFLILLTIYSKFVLFRVARGRGPRRGRGGFPGIFHKSGARGRDGDGVIGGGEKIPGTESPCPRINWFFVPSPRFIVHIMKLLLFTIAIQYHKLLCVILFFFLLNTKFEYRFRL